MKKLLLASGLLLAAGSASAQDNIVKVNILSPIVKTGSFFFEHKLNDNSSVQLGALFTNWSIGDTKVTGFAITPEYRFYLSERKAAMEGFYVAPFVRYQNLTLKDTYTGMMYNSTTGTYTTSTSTDEASLDTFGGGVLVGHQWIFKQRFSLDAFRGPSYNGGSVSYKNGSNSGTLDAGSFEGFGIRTGITFGIAF